ncbi:Peptide-N(4)-(N-acetyl-beta-glucosaminyl)asparagine amidase [Wickerhamomyces ciferrii]|uniref:Peptide-N(4)-(N-acetyl-beta-glucosaminyl)asparagine amidase n=1 Tax=Wickerhamomyces ciferrii (strain ATCC 14091 / BCRC 22168 / CBS 111 / JCM 3599 / NBRC 0793 / NRRL Y-1031 F-60-10) TaxID=1206466 RepID=K0KZB4_WICCF|nr:Peptide-N(4)-(N-acetyl-beta-glucosaminyl)asparagine amidase [Wickerhamomyces ciferrii]CCH46694.1 Peptide-N(4)-(N-acetyl-beta-glucosaminyl)asparagine amidase [Wickerhamomyces ciferrii]
MTSNSIDFHKIAGDLNNRYKEHVYSKNQQDYTELVKIYRDLVVKSPLGRQLPQLFNSIFKYEDPLAQEAALDVIDLGKIYQGVDERTKKQEEQGDTLDIKYGYTDFIVMELLKWFKHDFFKWVNEPETSTLQGKARLIRVEPPTALESQDGNASSVEVYQCEGDGSIIRFPRYNDPVKLLETKKGRCGEWANCFCLILRSMGIRTRYVWNAEDHVWCEIYSESQKRWIHIDSCEESFDNPTLYNKGWGKKMSYVISYSIDGTQDVSKRYVVDKDKSLPRNKINELDLQKILRFLTVNQRRNLGKDEIYKLSIEDSIEKLELNGQKPIYLQSDIVQPRQSGNDEWKEKRGEDGK